MSMKRVLGALLLDMFGNVSTEISPRAVTGCSTVLFYTTSLILADVPAVELTVTTVVTNPFITKMLQPF